MPSKAAVSEQRAMRPMPSNYQRFALNPHRLPPPAEFFAAEGLKLLGTGVWRSALCPFHADTNPSLRVLIGRGAFRCMACGVHGGDVLAFHMQRRGLGFVDAAKDLGAWERLP